MKAFEIKVNGKLLDYRISANLDLEDVKKFFAKNYVVKKIWQEKRHVVGILEKNAVEYFLKLSPTEGISATTQIEYKWNNEFNKLSNRDINFWIPKNIESGFYKENLFYMITDYFKGELLAKRPIPGIENEEYKNYINQIIELSELIQNLDVSHLSEKDYEPYGIWFLEKTKAWQKAIPQETFRKYKLEELLAIVETGFKKLERKTRHGDFTPWHMIKLENGKIGLIDGEHAMKNGVEYYDIGYLIQRVFSVLEDADFAKEIFQKLMKKNYNLEKLKVILAARAIGGFCDETLINKISDFERANRFKDWVMNLT